MADVVEPAPDHTPGDLTLIIVMGMGWWENRAEPGGEEVIAGSGGGGPAGVWRVQCTELRSRDARHNFWYTV